MNEEFKPCPFCGAGETQLDRKMHWTGMRNVQLSATVKHWCTREEGQPQSFIQIVGKTDEDAISAWNTRV